MKVIENARIRQQQLLTAASQLCLTSQSSHILPYLIKKLSCRRETARRFVSLNISLSYSRHVWSRRDSVLLNRLRIGHTRLTHSFLLSGDDLPECGTSQCPLTVKHILVECVDLKHVRNKHFVASSIKDLFDNIEAHKIIDFIKETRFYKQIKYFHINICYLFFLF